MERQRQKKGKVRREREGAESKISENSGRDLNISALQGRKRSQSLFRTVKEIENQREERNRQQHLRVVGEVHLGKLLKITSKSPDPGKFHKEEEEERVRQVSSKIVWDDLTGMDKDTKINGSAETVEDNKD